MKRWMINAGIMALVAGLIVLAQWLVVRAGNAFTLVGHEGQTYKVISYGFPFRVIVCDPVIGLATPEDQIHWRLIGNWTLFFLFGLMMMKTRKTFRSGSRGPHSAAVEERGITRTTDHTDDTDNLVLSQEQAKIDVIQAGLPLHFHP